MRKGQAAMEFLMTYGWAILIALIAVGALYYMNVKPKNIVQESCIIGSNPCDATLTKAGALNIVYTNGLGKSINITDVNVTGDATCSDATPHVVASGEKITLSLSGCTPNKPAGDIASLNVAMQYKDMESGLTHPLSGQVTVKIQ